MHNMIFRIIRRSHFGSAIQKDTKEFVVLYIDLESFQRRSGFESARIENVDKLFNVNPATVL